MKRGLFAVMALLTIFAMISCDNGSGTSDNITIKFDLDGGPGTKPNDVIITKGGTLGKKYTNMAGDATHVFLGWFDGDNEVTANTVLNASVTLKAKWNVLQEVPEGSMRITFNLGGAPGTPPDHIDLVKGTAITAEQIPDDPEWEGYTFEGWYNGDTKLVAGLSWQDNIVFTAKWTASNVGLTPWAPPANEQPTMPTEGYKNYYGSVTDPEDWTYTTFAGTGNVGSIEDNGDGTYNVTIKTNPGGVSLLAFINQDYTFKNGYYVSFNFPEDTDAKPIMALTGAATGSRNDDGLDWQSIYNVNRVDGQGYVPINDDVYLAGDIAFARDDLNTLYKSIVLTLVWSADEETEYYEFTLKKLLITTGEDLTPPEVNTMTPWPHEVAEPTDWIAFPPSTETINATFYPWNDSNKIVGNTVTVISNAGGRSLVRLYGDEFKYQKGFYLSVNLPNNSVKPQKIYALGITGPEHDGDWTASTLVDPEDITKFVAGKVDFTWASDTNTTAYTGVILDIYWYAGQTDALYTFTINKILVAGEAGAPPTPPEGPEPKLTKLKTYLASSEWGFGTTTTWNSNYEQDPFAGNFTGTATVTGPNNGPFVIAGVEGGTDNVKYLVINLSFNADAVGKTYECTLSDLAVSDASGNSLLSVGTLPTGVVATSTPGTYTITVTAAATSQIILPVSTATAQAASFNYKIVLPSTFKNPKLTLLKTYLASSEWGFGTTTTWNSNYEQDPFAGNFTGTATVTGPDGGPFVIAGVEGGTDNVKYLVINLSFNADAVGKKYECTLSDLAVSDASDNSLLSVGTLPAGVVETSTPGTYTITVTAAATSQIILPISSAIAQAKSFNYKMVLPSTFK